MQRTKIDAVSKLQEKRVEQYREDLTKLREQLVGQALQGFSFKGALSSMCESWVVL